MNQQSATLTKRPAVATSQNKNGAGSGIQRTAPSSNKAVAQEELTKEQLVEKEKELNKDIMLERGKFCANGHVFEVKPIYLGEEDAYLESLTMSPVPKPIMDANGKETSLSEKEAGQFLQFFFSNRRLAEMESQSKRKIDRLFPNGKPITEAAIWRLKKTKRNYLFYCDNPNAMIIAMWLERKVSYRGRPIRFYDLERKFKMNKSEIERLICYLHELSGF